MDGTCAQVLGTPSREDIASMNPNYTDFKFPQIKAHPWAKVFSKRMPPDAVDLVSPRAEITLNLTSKNFFGWQTSQQCAMFLLLQ